MAEVKMVDDIRIDRIDPEFRAMIPPLSVEEREQLEANLETDGCREPLVVWCRNLQPHELEERGYGGTCKGGGCVNEYKEVPADEWECGDGRWECPECGYGIAPWESECVLLDGHHRLEICTRLGIPYQTQEMDFANREEAADFIDANQLGRRNLTPEQMSLLRGRRYNRMKKAQGGTGANQYKEQNGQNVHSAKTSETLAKQHGVDEKTIRRDGQFAAAVETLKPTVPDIEQRVMAGDIPSKQAVVEAAKNPESATEKLMPHVARNSGENEWYTPREYIDAAVEVMGKIDCDPASTEIANRVVQADTFFTKEQDGLKRAWNGCVWMNPPYAQPLVTQFSETIVRKYGIGEVEQACILVNNATETKWFQEMLACASAVCFVRGRVRFLDPDGNPGAPLQGQAVIYFGPNDSGFVGAFSRFGQVLAGNGNGIA